eukprot:1021782-Rhodomonas_salina.3
MGRVDLNSVTPSRFNSLRSSHKVLNQLFDFVFSQPRGFALSSAVLVHGVDAAPRSALDERVVRAHARVVQLHDEERPVRLQARREIAQPFDVLVSEAAAGCVATCCGLERAI